MRVELAAALALALAVAACPAATGPVTRGPGDEGVTYESTQRDPAAPPAGSVPGPRTPASPAAPPAGSRAAAVPPVAPAAPGGGVVERIPAAPIARPTRPSAVWTENILGARPEAPPAGSVAGPDYGPPVPAVPLPLPTPDAVTVAPSVPTGKSVAELLSDARRLEASGDDVGARAAFAQVVAEHPHGEPALEARASLAEDALAREDYPAARALATLGDELGAARDALAFRLEVAGAEAERHLQSFAAATSGFLRALGRAQAPTERDVARRGLAAAALLGGEPERAEAVVAASPLVPVGAPLGQVRLVTADLALGGMARDELARLYRDIPRESPYFGFVALAWAEDACAHADPDTCGVAASLAAERLSDGPSRARADALVEHVRAWRQVAPHTLGVLLPESGRYGSIGKAARAAIEQALAATPGVTVLWRDTAGDATQAAKLAEELILTDHVTALLGPVGEKESAAVAAVSQRFAVPHVVLSSAEGLVDVGPNVIRVRQSLGEQARAVARWSATSAPAGRPGRVAILYPQNAGGDTAMEAFWDEVVRLGGDVWAVEGYDPETNDFNGVVQKLLGASKPGTGDSGFDALFIPDVGPKVRRLVPFLKYWGVLVKTAPRGRGVQLLGASGWNHPSVIDRGDNLTDNAVFADAFFYDPDDRATLAFGTAFYLAQKEKPRPFHAEVFDATGLIAPLVAAVPGSDHAARVELLRRLLGTHNHQGVTGLMSVLPDGSVLKAPRLLTIDLDDIRLRLSDDEEEFVRGKRVAPDGQ